MPTRVDTATLSSRITRRSMARAIRLVTSTKPVTTTRPLSSAHRLNWDLARQQVDAVRGSPRWRRTSRPAGTTIDQPQDQRDARSPACEPGARARAARPAGRHAEAHQHQRHQQPGGGIDHLRRRPAPASRGTRARRAAAQRGEDRRDQHAPSSTVAARCGGPRRACAAAAAARACQAAAPRSRPR